MVAMASFTAAAFRFYDSDGGEAASSPLENQNTNHALSVSADTSIQVRYRIDETGGADGSSMADWSLFYSKNGGTATQVPTTDSGDGIIAATAGLTNDNATTNRATNGITDGSGSFVAGEQSTDGIVDDLLITASDFTEVVYGVQFIDANVSDTDTFVFSINEVDSNAVSPQITISKAGTDVLTADDVESASEVTAPAIGQEHDLLANDVESAAEATAPVIGQEHALLADDVESATEATAPALGVIHNLLANSVESAAEVTAPVIGQDHQLLADDVESASEATTPVIGQDHALLADDVESASEATAPTLSESNILLADDVESASEVTAPVIGQEHALLADDAESTSEVSAPAVGQEHALLANDVESATEVTAPVLAEAGTVDNLLADDVESASEVTAPAVGQEHALLANDIESAAEVTTPTLLEGGADVLLANDVESASSVTTPTLGQVHILDAVNAASASEVSAPAVLILPTTTATFIFDSPEHSGNCIFDSPYFEAITAEQNSGGYTSFWDDFERELNRRKKEEKRRLKRKKKARKIPDELTRQLYLAEREIEAEEARRAELARLNRLSAENRAFVAGLKDGMELVLLAALERQSYSTMERLERELLQAKKEEEEFLLMASQILLQAV